MRGLIAVLIFIVVLPLALPIMVIRLAYYMGDKLADDLRMFVSNSINKPSTRSW